MGASKGWIAAATWAAVAACGGAAERAVSRTPGLDGHAGPDQGCHACKVTGGGQVVVSRQEVQLTVDAIPETGAAAGPGFAGQGVAAKGQLRLQSVPAGGIVDVVGEVDTILGCAREGGVLVATFSGTIPGEGRFTAVVADRPEPAADSVAFLDPVEIPSIAVAHGNLQVHARERCEVPCEPGQCLGHDDHLTCEPCRETGHDPPSSTTAYQP
jgi:hypothetical protein